MFLGLGHFFMVLSCIATIKLLLRRTLVRLIILISFFLTVFTITHFIDGIIYFFLDKKSKKISIPPQAGSPDLPG